MKHPIIIIGTGLAGYQLAREFRKLDSESSLMMITADAGHFYSKPQLSTAMHLKKTAANLYTATAEAMATQLNANILTHTHVTHINAREKTVSTTNATFRYEKLVLACGADIVKAPLEGNAVHDILSINNLQHYAIFEDLIKNKRRIAILGAGLIGCEFANDLSNAGFKVSLIAPAQAPLDLLLPISVGKLLQTALESNGVCFYLQTLAQTISKTATGYLLHLANGTQLETDVVLSAIGLKPHTQLAINSDIKVNRGIIVNRQLQTSAAEVYALGDCAEVEGHVLPYITPLLNCTRALAKTLTGNLSHVEYPAMPVVVKTPAHPIAVCPPPKDIHGEWRIEISDNTARALFYDKKDQLYGFVLTNDAVKERMQLAKQIPALI